MLERLFQLKDRGTTARVEVRRREITPGSLVLAALCLTYYVFGLPH